MPNAFPTISPIRLRSGARNRSSLARGPIYAGRLFSRRAVDLRVRLVTLCEVNGRTVELVVHGRTVDLSRSGAGLTLTRDLPAGAEVMLCLQLPTSDEPLRQPGKPATSAPGTPLCLRARVVRRRGFRIGIQFVQPTAEQRLLLCEFCYSFGAAHHQPANGGPCRH